MGSFDFVELLFRLAIFSFLYALGALVVGQAFGDKYGFAQIWPTSAIFGVIFAAIGAFRFSLDGSLSRGDGLALFVFFAISCGLAFNLFLYVLPRGVGWFGLVEMPKASWGVKL